MLNPDQLFDKNFKYKRINPYLKGNIKKLPYYNAFNKKTLGTIPTKEEYIIIQKEQEKKGFNSSIKRFDATNYLSDKELKALQSANKTQINESSAVSSSKVEYTFIKNDFHKNPQSLSPRFQDYTLYKKGFSPGPGQYQTKEKKLNSFRYNSIFQEQTQEALQSSKIKQLINSNRNKSFNFSINNRLLPKDLKILILEKEKPKDQFSYQSSRNISPFLLRNPSFPGPGKYNSNTTKKQNANKGVLITKLPDKPSLNKLLNQSSCDIHSKKLLNSLIEDKIKEMDLNSDICLNEANASKVNTYKPKKSIIMQNQLETKSTLDKGVNVDSRMVNNYASTMERKLRNELIRINLQIDAKKSMIKKLDNDKSHFFKSKINKNDISTNHFPGPAFYKTNKLPMISTKKDETIRKKIIT